MVDGEGNLYGGLEGIDKISPEGTILAHFLEGTIVLALDLAADQCTMFHVGGIVGTNTNTKTIRRFDVCSGMALADFGETLDGNPFALRLLQDGGLLVGTRGGVVRLDSLGRVIQKYPVSGIIAWIPICAHSGSLQDLKT